MKATTYLTGTNEALLAVAGWEGVPDTVTVLAGGCIYARYRWDNIERVAAAFFDSIEELARYHAEPGASAAVLRMFMFASQRFGHVVTLDDVTEAMSGLDEDQYPLPPRWGETLHVMIDQDQAVTA